jgi:uncharacterized protein YaaR (DUF327 family)
MDGQATGQSALRALSEAEVGETRVYNGMNSQVFITVKAINRRLMYLTEAISARLFVVSHLE